MSNNLNPMSNISSGGIPMDTSNLASQSTPMETDSSLPQLQQVGESPSSTPVMSNLQVVLNNPNVTNSPSLQVALNNMNATTNTTGLSNAHIAAVSTSPSLAAQSSVLQAQSSILHTQSSVLQTPSPSSVLQTSSPVIHVQNPVIQTTSQQAPSVAQIHTTVPVQLSSGPQTTSATQSSFQTSTSSSHLPSMSQGKPSTEHLNQILTKPRLQELVREVDPTEQLDEEVEELMLQLADDFVESAVNSACLLAKHRHASSVDVKDVQLHLERNWNMWIPGFGTDELRPYKRAPVTDAHRQRMALIRKTIKKY